MKNEIILFENQSIRQEVNLVALTLLIAQSNPKEKDILTDLVMNFLVLKEKE